MKLRRIFAALLTRTPHTHLRDIDCDGGVVAVVPIAGYRHGRDVINTAVLYRCAECAGCWEEIFDGQYTLKDFQNDKK